MYRQEEELRGLQGGRAGHRMYVKTIVPLILHACKTGARKALCRQKKDRKFVIRHCTDFGLK